MTITTVLTPHCPDGIDGHRTLGDKPGLAGKRDMGQEDDFRTGLFLNLTWPLDGHCVLEPNFFFFFFFVLYKFHMVSAEL